MNFHIFETDFSDREHGAFQLYADTLFVFIMFAVKDI